MKAPPEPLKLTINIEIDGQVHKIEYNEKESVQQLAMSFVRSNSLQEHLVDSLAQSIKSFILAFKSRFDNKQRFEENLVEEQSINDSCLTKEESVDKRTRNGIKDEVFRDLQTNNSQFSKHSIFKHLGQSIVSQTPSQANPKANHQHDVARSTNKHPFKSLEKHSGSPVLKNENQKADNSVPKRQSVATVKGNCDRQSQLIETKALKQGLSNHHDTSHVQSRSSFAQNRNQPDAKRTQLIKGRSAKQRPTNEKKTRENSKNKNQKSISKTSKIQLAVSQKQAKLTESKVGRANPTSQFSQNKDNVYCSKVTSELKRVSEFVPPMKTQSAKSTMQNGNEVVARPTIVHPTQARQKQASRHVNQRKSEEFESNLSANRQRAFAETRKTVNKQTRRSLTRNASLSRHSLHDSNAKAKQSLAQSAKIEVISPTKNPSFFTSASKELLKPNFNSQTEELNQRFYYKQLAVEAARRKRIEEAKAQLDKMKEEHPSFRPHINLTSRLLTEVG